MTWQRPNWLTDQLEKSFVIQECPPELKEVSAALLADLHNQAFNFGGRGWSEFLFGDDMPTVGAIVPNLGPVWIGVPPDGLGICIIGPTPASVEGSFMIKFGNDHAVLWDRRVSVENVIDCISFVDEKAREERAFDIQGHRKKFELESPKPSYAVEEFFVHKGTTVPFFVDDRDVEAAIVDLSTESMQYNIEKAWEKTCAEREEVRTLSEEEKASLKRRWHEGMVCDYILQHKIRSAHKLREQFDFPDQLEIIQPDPNSSVVHLVRKDEVDHHAKRMTRVVPQVLTERGIDPKTMRREDGALVGLVEVVEIREEIARRMVEA